MRFVGRSCGGGWRCRSRWCSIRPRRSVIWPGSRRGSLNRSKVRSSIRPACASLPGFWRRSSMIHKLSPHSPVETGSVGLTGCYLRSSDPSGNPLQSGDSGSTEKMPPSHKQAVRRIDSFSAREVGVSARPAFDSPNTNPKRERGLLSVRSFRSPRLRFGLVLNRLPKRAGKSARPPFATLSQHHSLGTPP